MPEVHDDAEKRQFFSSVEVFDLNTGCWERRTTSGTPPLGVVGYSCVAVRNNDHHELHYFGGECARCGRLSRFHNSVHSLNTSTLEWKTLAPSTTEEGAPMKKYHCGMVHFADIVDEQVQEDFLYVVGGWGLSIPSSQQPGAQYRKKECIYNGVCTNEQHIFSLTTSKQLALKIR